MKSSIEEIRQIQEHLKQLKNQVHQAESQLRELQNFCHHDECRLPFIDAFGIARPRVVRCKICDKFMGPYCKVNPKHICEFDSPDKKAKDYHDKCIHCGKLYED